MRRLDPCDLFAAKRRDQPGQGVHVVLRRDLGLKAGVVTRRAVAEQARRCEQYQTVQPDKADKDAAKGHAGGGLYWLGRVCRAGSRSGFVDRGGPAFHYGALAQKRCAAGRAGGAKRGIFGMGRMPLG